MGARIARVLIGIVIVFWIGVFAFSMLKDKSGVTLLDKIRSSIPFLAPKAKPQPKDTSNTVAEEPENILPQVRALRLKTIDYQDSLPVMGSVKGITQIELKFEISGVVKSIKFREGEKIKKGDIIAMLDSKDIELKQAYAHAKFNSAQAAFNSVLKQLEIHKKLYEAGAIIKSKMEQIELEVESARFQLETSRSEQELADNELRKTSMYAAKDGVMGPRDAEEGEFVTPQDKIGVLYEIQDVFVEVGVVERDIDKVKIGQMAKIYVDAYPGTFFEGPVAYIFPVVEGKSRTLTVKIRVANPAGLLLPGMFCRTELSIAEIPDALIIPSSALINSAGQTMLSIIPQSTVQGTEEELTGIAQLRPVKIGYMNSDYAQIESGARPGDLVILEVQGQLEENKPVKIVNIEDLSF